ncbi:MAG: DUF2190 family protein [Chloroflexi bacterium]|nr:DUF2190 family protein [Chloroflexota bacterium]
MAENLKFIGTHGIGTVPTDPASPASGDPVLVGKIGGVAVNAKDGSGNTVVDFGPSVYSLSVKGIDGVGNAAVAVGDEIFYVTADTPKLSKKATGVHYGFALEAITSGSTATIKVLVK